MPLPWCFDYYGLVIQFNIRYRDSSVLFFFLKVAEASWGLLWFHMHFWSICSSSVKHTIGILIGIALDVEIALGNRDILMMLILPIHEQQFVLPLIFIFFNVL